MSFGVVLVLKFIYPVFVGAFGSQSWGDFTLSGSNDVFFSTIGAFWGLSDKDWNLDAKNHNFGGMNKHFHAKLTK